MPSGSVLYQDSGFQGFTLAGINIVQPKKKPKGRELTVGEKENNRDISSIRTQLVFDGSYTTLSVTLLDNKRFVIVCFTLLKCIHPPPHLHYVTNIYKTFEFISYGCWVSFNRFNQFSCFFLTIRK